MSRLHTATGGMLRGDIKQIVLVVAVLSLGAVFAPGVATFLSRETAHKEVDDYAVSALATDVTTAPNVEVDLLPSDRILRNRRFDDFDIAEDGGMAVLVDGDIYDMSTGKRVVRTSEGISSFAFVAGGLAVITQNGKIAFDSAEGLQTVGSAPVTPASICTTSDGQQLLMFKSAPGSSQDDVFALCRFSPGGQVELLAVTDDPIIAAAGDENWTWFSCGTSLFRLSQPGHPVLTLDLPFTSDSIIGIAVVGDVVYFSKNGVVSVLRGSVSLPIVLGIGGKLKLGHDGLYVLDSKTHRVFRILHERSKADGGLPIARGS